MNNEFVVVTLEDLDAMTLRTTRRESACNYKKDSHKPRRVNLGVREVEDFDPRSNFESDEELLRSPDFDLSDDEADPFDVSENWREDLSRANHDAPCDVVVHCATCGSDDGRRKRRTDFHSTKQ